MSEVSWQGWDPFEGALGRPMHRSDLVPHGATSTRSWRRERSVGRQLTNLLARNGESIGTSDHGLQRLDDWYQAHVEADETKPDRLSSRWYAVGLDIGLFLGEAIIERASGIDWCLLTAGPKDISFQRPVLMGFSVVANPLYNVDPEILVAAHGHRLIAGLEEPRDRLVQVVRVAASRA